MKAGIDIYASEETYKLRDIKLNNRTHIIKQYQSAQIEDTFEVIPFALQHDCEGSLGFVIKADNVYLLFAPDTAFIKQKFKFPFSIIMLECSYDNYMLQLRVDTEDINESLAKRLLNSHMEKTVAMDYIAKYCDLSKCRELHLLHMSNDNIDKELTRAEFEQRFFIKTIICKRNR